MSDISVTIMVGRLTRDPQLRYLPNQTPVCEFGLAAGQTFKSNGEKREDTCFVDCSIFGKGGEIFQQYMTKGKQCAVVGRLKLDQWEDKNGGGKRSKLKLNVNEFQFLGAPTPRDDSDQTQDNYPKQRPAPTQGESQPPYDETDKAFAEDDIPF